MAAGALEQPPACVGLVLMAIAAALLLRHRRDHPPHRRDRARRARATSSPSPTRPGSPAATSSSRSSWADAQGVRRIRNVTFARVGGKALQARRHRPVARRSRRAAHRRPALLQIHGGGWVIGDKREQGLPLLNHMAAQGWVGFNANYRLSPEATFPDHLVDLKRALAWIREHADEYGIDPDFICVTGGSAGGHLTALMALTAERSRLPAGLRGRRHVAWPPRCPFYGIYDFTPHGAFGADP